MFNLMTQGDLSLIQKALNKWRSEGFIPLLQSAKWYIPYKVARKSRIFFGERQFEIYTNARYRIQKIIYSAPADPWRPIDIDPSDVQYQAKPCTSQWGSEGSKAGIGTLQRT